MHRILMLATCLGAVGLGLALGMMVAAKSIDAGLARAILVPRCEFR